MPTYEYRCGACGHVFERFQKMSDEPVKTCPECGEEEAERLISPGGGLVFKGSGFYATDYRNPPPKEERKGDGSDGKDGSGEKGGKRSEAPSGDGGDG